jgi:sec-independent protein translocase protein TatB
VARTFLDDDASKPNGYTPPKPSSAPPTPPPERLAKNEVPPVDPDAT